MSYTKRLDIIFLLSLSNLLLFNYWLKIGIFSEEIRYYFFAKPSSEILLGLLLFFTFFVISLILFKFVKKNKVFEGVFIILSFILILDIFRTASNFFSIKYIIENKFIFLSIILIFFIITYQFFNKVIKFIKFIFIFLSPFIVVIFLNIFNIFFILDWDNNKDKIFQKNYTDKQNKILVLIFDELDFRVLRNNKYQNFDEILGISDIYTNAFPSGDATLDIMPSILTGYNLSDSTKDYNFQLNEIIFSHKNKRKLISKEQNLFKIINDNNYKIGLFGIYHRYCNIFFKELNECYEPNDEQYTINNLGIKKYLIYSLADIIPGSSKINILKKLNPNNFNSHDLPRLRIENIKKFQKLFPKLINDNDFIFIHIPLPHAPWVFFDNRFNDRYHDQFDENGYYENMKLTDKFLGDVIEFLKNKKIYHNTTIFLASDHGWRNGDDIFLGSNSKKIENRGGDVLLSIKRKNQINQKIINEKIINFELFNLIKKEL